MDRAVGLDGLELVPARVALDLLARAVLEQLDEMQVLFEGLFRAVRQVNKHGPPQAIEPCICLLEEIDKVGVRTPGDDRGMQLAVKPAESEGIGVGSSLLHPRGDPSQLGDVGAA